MRLRSNCRDAQWFARGAVVNTNPGNRFYIAAGDRWLKADGQTLVTDMDGRYGIAHDLKPGEEEEVPLQVTAPKEPGEYVLRAQVNDDSGDGGGGEQCCWTNALVKVNVK